MIQGLNNKDSADRICEELKKIVGINKIEIYFETGQMIPEAGFDYFGFDATGYYGRRCLPDDSSEAGYTYHYVDCKNRRK